METTRQNKIARLIQKELSDIFLRETKSMNGVLISVSAVRISPDMSIVRAYLSIFPSNKGNEILENIESVHTSASVAKATPHTDIPDMIFMA